MRGQVTICPCSLPGDSKFTCFGPQKLTSLLKVWQKLEGSSGGREGEGTLDGSLQTDEQGLLGKKLPEQGPTGHLTLE